MLKVLPVKFTKGYTGIRMDKGVPVHAAVQPPRRCAKGPSAQALARSVRECRFRQQLASVCSVDDKRSGAAALQSPGKPAKLAAVDLDQVHLLASQGRSGMAPGSKR